MSGVPAGAMSPMDLYVSFCSTHTHLLTMPAITTALMCGGIGCSEISTTCNRLTQSYARQEGCRLGLQLLIGH